MTRDQMIEEMATIMSSRNTKGCPGCKIGKKSDCYQNATLLYNAGYRKDPEFTPVELRDLPQKKDLLPLRLCDMIEERFIPDMRQDHKKLLSDYIKEQTKNYETALLSFAFNSFYEDNGYPYIVALDNFGYRWEPGEPWKLKKSWLLIRFEDKPDLGEIGKRFANEYDNVKLYDFSKFTDADWIKLGFDPKNRR